MIEIESAEIVPGIPRRMEVAVAHVAHDDPVVDGTLGVSARIEQSPLLWDVADIGEEHARLTSRFGPRLDVPMGREALRRLDRGMLLVAQPRVLRLTRRVEHVGMVTIERILDNEREVNVDLPAVRVHCPRRDGCSADYTFSTEHGHDGKFDLTIVGLGGGASAKFTGKESETWSIKGAPDGHCREATIPGRMLIGDGVLKIDGQVIRSGTMTDFVSVDRGGRKEREIPPDADDCLVPLEAAKRLPQHWWVDRLDEGEPMEVEVELARETSGSFSMGLETKGIVDLKLEYTRTTSTTRSISTTLAPGATYAMYAPDTDEGMERCWTTG